MRSRLKRCTAAVLLVALGAPTIASAQDEGAKHDAQARFEEGMKRVRSGDFEGGRLAFIQAYAVLKNPDILWNLALSELKSSHPLERSQATLSEASRALHAAWPHATGANPLR